MVRFVQYHACVSDGMMPHSAAPLRPQSCLIHLLYLEKEGAADAHVVLGQKFFCHFITKLF